jgi:hypothetical protein
MARIPDNELDRLLARGGLSGPDRDRIFEQVLRDVGAERGRRPVGRMLALASAAVTAAAIVAVVVWTSLSPGGREGGFRTKGSGEGVVVEIGCRHGEHIRRDRCTRGDRLLLQIDGLQQEAYLAAWADGPDGRRVWYFPADDGAMPRLRPGAGPVLVDRSVRIGDEHAPGNYQVTVLILSSRLGRAEILDAEPMTVQSFDLEVTP